MAAAGRDTARVPASGGVTLLCYTTAAVKAPRHLAECARHAGSGAGNGGSARPDQTTVRAMARARTSKRA